MAVERYWNAIERTLALRERAVEYVIVTVMEQKRYLANFRVLEVNFSKICHISHLVPGLQPQRKR